MGIRDRLAEHDARFISFTELLAAIAEVEGVTIQEVARAWSLEPILRALKPVLRSHGDGDYLDGDGSAHHYELECAVNGGKAWMDDAAQSELRIGEPGFFRQDAESALLVAANWPIPARLTEPTEAPSVKSPQPAPPRPDLLPFALRVNIVLDEAATILNDAHEGGVGSWKNWWNALADAADSGQIQAGSWSMERGEQPLSHADIREWCRAGGIVWPVPLPQGRQPDIPPGDPDLVASLDRAQARIAELEHERAALLKRIETTTKTAEATSINSPTLQRILDAVAQYPTWRATQNQEPNLKAVLGWQEKQQDGKGNASRVAHVAHHIIAEHFGLKS